MTVTAVHMILDPGEKLQCDVGGLDDGPGPVDGLIRDLSVARGVECLGHEAVHGLGGETGARPGRPHPSCEKCRPGDAVALDTEDLVSVPNISVNGQQGGQEGQGESHGVQDGEELTGHTRSALTAGHSRRHGGNCTGVVTQGNAHAVIKLLDTSECGSHPGVSSTQCWANMIT